MTATPENTIDIARVLDESAVDHVHYLPETDSTNEVALSRAAQTGSGECELVLAQRQRRGKGRGDNRWHSGEGSLTFSLITRRLPLPKERTPGVSLTAGLAVCLAVEELAPRAEARLKWPNDVYLNGSKAAGILIESPADAGDRFVVGVGLNVNNDLTAAPAEVRSRAASLRAAAGGPLPLTEVLLRCLWRWEECLDRLLADDPGLPELWGSYSLLTGRRVRLATPRGVVEGRCEGLAPDGALRLATDAGEQEWYGGVVEWFE